MARLEYVTKEDLPDNHQDLLEVDEDNPDDVILNIHRALANNPRLLEAWDEWAWALYEEAGEPQTRELVILAVARATDSQYIWHQHAPIALEHGLSREEIQAIASQEFDGFTAAESAVLDYATAIVNNSLNDSIHSRIEQYHSSEGTVSYLMLASEYLQISSVIEALAVDLETEFVGCSWRISTDRRRC